MVTSVSRVDADIKKDILAELKWDPEIDETDIGVTVKDGSAVLMGTVSSYFQKTAANLAAKRIRGVRSIADEIEVKLPYQMEGSDEDISQRISDLFEWNAQIPADDIKSVVRSGIVTISGDVDWQYQKNYIQKQVEDIKGVRSVINNINLRKKATASDIKNEIMRALYRHASVEASRVNVSIDGGTITLTGIVDNYFEKDLIKNAAWSAAGVTKVIDNLKTLSGSEAA